MEARIKKIARMKSKNCYSLTPHPLLWVPLAVKAEWLPFVRQMETGVKGESCVGAVGKKKNKKHLKFFLKWRQALFLSSCLKNHDHDDEWRHLYRNQLESCLHVLSSSVRSRLHSWLVNWGFYWLVHLMRRLYCWWGYFVVIRPSK